MRVLDLGSHDGFVSTWLARQLKEKGHDVEVCGVEANSEAVKIGNRRLKDHGIKGTFKQGLAEDAVDLFGEDSFEIVVAYELIEHVPDVNHFLTVCEAMCAPGGRIYISTPDGTFGAGQNPHHLRVYRALDLFDLIRQRGKVKDMIVGADTVSVISYTPTRDLGLPVAIYCGAGWERWSPTDIEFKGLGGSETAAVRLAEALSNDGYSVTVYGEVEQCAFKQVLFRHHSAFDPLDQRHAVISSRVPQLMAERVNAERKVLWMHDTDYGPAINQQVVDGADAIMVLSDWHREHVAGLYPFAAEKLIVTSNGIEPAYFTRDLGDVERAPHRCLYTSSPDRGLDQLLEIWPEVRFHVPDAELHYAYASVYAAVAAKRPEVAAHHAKIQHLSEQEGVVNLGALTQPGVAATMRQAGVWLAPSYNTVHDVPFNETYCIGAVEAAAAGCRRVFGGWGALIERRFADEPLTWQVAAPIHDDSAAWVQCIVDAMTGADDRGYAPSQEALDCTWRKVAADFEDVFDRAVAPA